MSSQVVATGRWRSGGGLLIISLLASLAAAEEVPPEAPLPLQKRPYLVRLVVAFDDDPRLTTAYRRQVLGELRQFIERTAGQVWEVSIDEQASFTPVGAAGLERLNRDGVTSDPRMSAVDQAFFIAVRASGGRTVVSVRRWQGTIEELGPVVTSETFDRRETAAAALRLIESQFRPVLSVEDYDQETRRVRLNLQGGELAAVGPDDGPLRRQVSAGDALVAFLRYFDKEGRVARIQPLPWTYLVVDSVDREDVVCTAQSGIRVPLSPPGRKSVELLAVVVRPQHAATQLQVVSQANPTQPLVGHYVAVTPKVFTRDEDMSVLHRLVTNRRGIVEIPADPERLLVWLYVSSGSNLLARVPYVPGVSAFDTIPVPDDSLRLSVEGEIAQLKGELVDIVAKRFTLLSRARLFAGKDDAERVREQLAAFDALQGRAEFRQQLDSIRVNAVDQARRKGDRLAQRQIERLCGATAELIDRYLDADKVKLAREEIAQLLPGVD